METHHNHLSFEYESPYQYSVDATDKDAVLGKRHRENDETESYKVQASVIGGVFQMEVLGCLACLVCEGLVDMMDALEMGEKVQLQMSLCMPMWVCRAELLSLILSAFSVLCFSYVFGGIFLVFIVFHRVPIMLGFEKPKVTPSTLSSSNLNFIQW